MFWNKKNDLGPGERERTIIFVNELMGALETITYREKLMIECLMIALEQIGRVNECYPAVFGECVLREETEHIARMIEEAKKCKLTK